MKREAIFRIVPGLAGAAKGDPATMGMKSFDLARMARMQLPIPPAFVLGTPHCRRWSQDPQRHKKELAALLEEQMRWLQSVTGQGFGDARKPLLVSVRSGAPISMPGMMDTLLNVGLCDATVNGLLRITGNPRLVWDSYRRLIQSFAEVVFETGPQPFEAALGEALARERLASARELDHLSLAALAKTYLRLFSELTGKAFPQQPFAQLELAVESVFASWNAQRAREYRALHGIPGDIFTAATIQKMVFGNAGGTSGSGVGFTRDPDSGEKGLYFDFLFDSQGEDVVSGRATGSDAGKLFLVLPEARQELAGICTALEREFGDVQEFEFTIQEGSLYLLQTRSAKRTDWAALRIAVEQVREGLIGKDEALARLGGIALEEIGRRVLSASGLKALCHGQPAGIGVVAGPLALDVEAARRSAAEGGRSAVLVREDIAADDIAGIAISAGVLTARGNRTSHAAVVARQLGKPCITGCGGLRIDAAGKYVQFGARSVAEGDTITLDSNTGTVYLGEGEIVVERPGLWIDEIGKWRQPDER